MRPLIFLPLLLMGLLCMGNAARAQQQESRMNKILKPDLSESFNATKGKSFGSKSFDKNDGKTIELKTVAWPKVFNGKEFLTGNFKNDKSFWMGDFKYNYTKEANTTPRSVLALPTHPYDTKSVALKTASGMDKDYAAATVPTRDFRGKERGKLETSLTPEQAANNGYKGDLTELKSIDDVRALLNKSK